MDDEPANVRLLERLLQGAGYTELAQTTGRELLASVYDRFTEGFDTADLRAARVLLGSFG